MTLRYKDKDCFISYLEFSKICALNFGKGKVKYKGDEHCLIWEKN